MFFPLRLYMFYTSPVILWTLILECVMSLLFLRCELHCLASACVISHHGTSRTLLTIFLSYLVGLCLIYQFLLTVVGWEVLERLKLQQMHHEILLSMGLLRSPRRCLKVSSHWFVEIVSFCISCYRYVCYRLTMFLPSVACMSWYFCYVGEYSVTNAFE